jgi:uncharacterized protein YkwD
MIQGARRSRGFQPDLDALDRRTLLSGGVSASLTGRVLRITGADEADVIQVMVSQNAGRQARAVSVVEVDGVGTFSGRIARIVINSGAGDDAITVDQEVGRPVKTRINAGDGNDVVTTGAGRYVIRGGSGVDVINGASDQPGSPGVSPVTAPVSNPPATIPPTSAPIQNSAFEQQIIDLINQHRQAAGLAPLRVNAQLNRAAEIHAENMAALDRFGHVLDGSSAPSPVDRLNQAGYRYRMAGENIAYNFTVAEGVVNAWMNSSGHRQNILNSAFTETGVIVRYNAQGEAYYVQVFGTPF